MKEGEVMFEEIIENCKNILLNCGIKLVPFNIVLSDVKCIGRYYYVNKKILIGKGFYENRINNGGVIDVYNVVLHEMIHAIISHSGVLKGHCDEWKELVKIVNDNTDYNITIETEAKGINDYNYKYIIQCDSCKKEFGFKRISNAIRDIKFGSPFCNCPNCQSNKLKVIKFGHK